MLNAGNLALIAFARQTGNGAGQIFALTVMIVAAAEVVVGLGLIVAMSRRKVELDVDKLSTSAAELIAASWLCLFSPRGRVVLLALAGNRISGRQAGSSRAGASRPFLCSAYVLGRLLTEGREERSHASSLWTWLSAGDFRADMEILVDPLSVFMMMVVSGVGFLIVAYATGYMAGDDEERRYHAYKALFVFSMLLLVQAGNLLSCSPAGAWSASPPTS